MPNDDTAKKQYDIPHNAHFKTITVDVIIPLYNAETTIEETVLSVYEQINPFQNKFFLDVAVCVFDDGSTDKSMELLTSLKEKYIRCGNGGIQVKLLVGANEGKLSRGAG